MLNKLGCRSAYAIVRYASANAATETGASRRSLRRALARALGKHRFEEVDVRAHAFALYDRSRHIVVSGPQHNPRRGALVIACKGSVVCARDVEQRVNLGAGLHRHVHCPLLRY
jgi:hypothetical protein